MLINTTRFGELEIDEERIIAFPVGLPGFENLNKFAILNPENIHPLSYLQSIEDPDVAFIVAPPFIFKKDYEPYIPDYAVEELEIIKVEEVALYCIIVVPEDYTKMTANLMAPIVINTAKMLGKQVILEEGDYPKRYPIFKTKEQKNEDESKLPLSQGGR